MLVTEIISFFEDLEKMQKVIPLKLKGTGWGAMIEQMFMQRLNNRTDVPTNLNSLST